ncbi:S-layer homology domain-containing protein [Tepidibacter hydrothermalis]|uniref:S-layer homology domain-containing protein n=1 Tax=Tepidibacter hydrothermalis TaxID=3036126 RepID=A0ABY8E7B3_9FIRM|nr:S-layer homology domain-containing protein [Tepidibacter hydrothermalis]WFD08780.1 S-layer homology domain-containing protein [Tepidibacter hydrothermalis]
MKKILTTFLTTSIFFMCFSFSHGVISNWAKDDISNMKQNNLVPESIISQDHFQDMITREEFAELAVLLYSKAKEIEVEELIEKDSEEPFLDTDNPYVAIAYNEGIVNGTSKVTFNPRDKITREAIATMLKRELQELGKDTTPKKQANYDDMNQVSDWAKDGLNYATQEGIINGVGNNLVAPKQNTTREQAIVMMSRIAKNNGWIDETTELVEKPNVPSNEYTIQDGFAIPKDTKLVYVEVAGKGSSYYLYASVESNMPDVDKQKELLTGLLNSNPNVINKSGKDYVLKQFDSLYDQHPKHKEIHGWYSPNTDPNNGSAMTYSHDMGNGYSIELSGRSSLCFKVIEN